MTAELAIVVPTYRELGNITRLYRALSAALDGHSWELVFVDDDSDDGSAEELAGLAQADDRVRWLRRVGRRGLSSACIEGIHATTAPFVCVMDADLQHDESVIPSMLNFLKEQGGGLAVASRYVSAGSTGTLPPARVFISRAATFLCRAISGVRLSDPLSGFFMIRRSLFDEAEPRLSGRGFKLLLDIVLSLPGRIASLEVPYSMRSREQGQSKLSAGVVWDLLVLLAYHALGRLIPARFVSFAAVGLSGVFVHMSVLWLLHRQAGLVFPGAQVLATVTAMTSNFMLNDLLTYSDLRLRGVAYVRGLLSFYLACAIGALINVAVADRMFALSVPWWLAGLSGVLCGAVWNYAVTGAVTWRSPAGTR
ncbi:MAG TPA: glycosyltransferase family 2 protein [Gammaproteobacteria bacterium]